MLRLPSDGYIHYERICLLSSRILEKHIHIFEYDVFFGKAYLQIFRTFLHVLQSLTLAIPLKYTNNMILCDMGLYLVWKVKLGYVKTIDILDLDYMQ